MFQLEFVQSITIKLRPGQYGAIDAKTLLAIGDIERGDGRMMAHLLGYVERFAVRLGVVPVRAKHFAQYGIVRFF